MRRLILPLLAFSLLPACGDDGDNDSNGGAKANPLIHDYCVAQCKRNDECQIENLFEGSDCVTICEGFTIAYGDCKPTKAVTDACIKAIEQNTCEAQKQDDEPEECAAICG